MTTRLNHRTHSKPDKPLRFLQSVSMLGVWFLAAISMVGCRPDSAGADSQETGSLSARSELTQSPSPWPIDAKTHQLRQFTKHAADLKINPALAKINMFPDMTLPDADITPIGVDTITVDELEELLAQGGWGVLDVRKPADVRKTGVIPGAVHYMYSFEGASAPADTRMLTQDVVRDLMAEHPKGLIVYCNGPKCFRSYNACLAIVQHWGFPSHRVRWFRGGAPAWRQSPLIPAQSLSFDDVHVSPPAG